VTTGERKRAPPLHPVSGDRNPDFSTRRREDAKESAVDGLGLGRLVVIHVVIGELSANLRAFAPLRLRVEKSIRLPGKGSFGYP
jgi:hypothetical protein